MINRETWVKIIKDFQEFGIPEMIQRDVKIPELEIKRTVSIIGPRRTGKTFLMFQTIKHLLEKKIGKNRILYLNFENDMLLNCKITDMRGMIEIYYEIYPENKNRKIYLFLDEIQNISNWEKFVRTIMDNEKIQIFISGSSSKLLSKELATCLRGRTLPYYVYPFSFKEFLKYKKYEIERYMSSSQKALLLNLLQKYIHGSYPETVILEQEKEKILQEIMDVTIYRDIVERFRVKNVKILKLLLKSLIMSNYFSVHKFYNYVKSMGIKISKNTIYTYIDYFFDSMIVFTLRKYSKSYKEVEQTTPKVYFVDNGLLVINGIENPPRLIENIVFIELIRRGLVPGSNLFYFESNKKEVDFVIREKGKTRQLIQVCYNIDDFNTKDRELSALVKASVELKCNKLLVITWNYEKTEQYKNKKIVFMPLWKWLLS